ncbi:hypothetical protein ACT29H_10940 [Thermophagus sp. OGC60D27]|uniref:hypothetical protein n=1 Tax=Thermophagus sp. OGC60D27 TaxID=3458415 RepID=UPI004038449D
MFGDCLNVLRVVDPLKCSVHYNKERRVVIGKYMGNISLDDMLYSMSELVWTESIPDNAEGLILDWQYAHLDFPANQYRSIVELWRKNLDFFKRFKIAAVANSPHNVAVIMLIAHADSRFCLQPFTSFGSALIWVRR